LSLLVACAATPAPPPAPVPDAGAPTCADGGTVGPLGSCVPETGRCDTCATSADCAPGATCGDLHGCRACLTGPACSLVTCLSSADCCSGFSCGGEDQPPLCGGACMRPEDECTDDASCGENALCVSEDVPCSCGQPTVLRCRPRCPETACAAGDFCDPGTHLCRPVPCPAFPCRDDQACLGPPTGDVRGCGPKPCTSHAECGAGFCADGACHRAFGSCTPPRP
jgi:hypothetical protein